MENYKCCASAAQSKPDLGKPNAALVVVCPMKSLPHPPAKLQQDVWGQSEWGAEEGGVQEVKKIGTDRGTKTCPLDQLGLSGVAVFLALTFKQPHKTCTTIDELRGCCCCSMNGDVFVVSFFLYYYVMICYYLYNISFIL